MDTRRTDPRFHLTTLEFCCRTRPLTNRRRYQTQPNRFRGQMLWGGGVSGLARLRSRAATAILQESPFLTEVHHGRDDPLH
jgi:hypothetical protein